MTMGPRQAEVLVASYLGRPPQDELEAAVVLESWGGVRPGQALATASRMTFPPAAASTSARHTGTAVLAAGEEETSLAEPVGAVALVLAVLVLAAVASGHGAEAAAEAWRPAMPATLGATWLLRRRYGAGPRAVNLLRRDAPVLLAGLAALVAPLMVVPPLGAMVAAFLVLGVGGSVTVLRGWGTVTAALVAGVAVSSALLDVGPVATMAAAVGLVGAAATTAVLTAPRSGRRPQPWRRAIPAALAGATTGAFLVVVSVAASGADTWLVGVALVPSLLANLVGGAHLATFWQEVPDALARVPLERSSAAARSVAIRVLTGGGALVVGVLLVLSLALRAVVDSFEPSAAFGPLLLGFGALALVAVVVTVLEAFAKPWWATTAGLAASGAHVAATEVGLHLAMATVGVAVGAALLVAIPPVVALLRRPEVTLATLV